MNDPIGCNDGCGAKVADMSEAEAKAWTYLEITKRYRCPACTRALAEANQQSKEAEQKEQP